MSGDDNAECEDKKSPVGHVDLRVWIGLVCCLLDKLKIKLVAHVFSLQTCNRHACARENVRTQSEWRVSASACARESACALNSVGHLHQGEAETAEGEQMK